MVAKSQPVAHTVSVAGMGVAVGGMRVGVGSMGVAVSVDVSVGGMGILVGVVVSVNSGGVTVGGMGVAVRESRCRQLLGAKARKVMESNKTNFFISSPPS